MCSLKEVFLLSIYNGAPAAVLLGLDLLLNKHKGLKVVYKGLKGRRQAVSGSIDERQY